MSNLTVYEFDTLAPEGSNSTSGVTVPVSVFNWLEEQCLRAAEKGDTPWLRMTQRSGCRVIQMTSYVGVIRAPSGYQIEVLPKIGSVIEGDADEAKKEVRNTEARKLLIKMLCCLRDFRHVQIDSAMISAERMPLLEIFINEFLRTVERVVKKGLRGDYRQRQDNLFALRGKLLMSSHLRQNLFRADRFFTEHDEFLMDRPENRLIRAALRRVLHLSRTLSNQQLAREFDFVFADIPPSMQVMIDFQQVRLDRGMGYYADALAWARIILDEESPLTGAGHHTAPSLLFPMEAVFEAYVAKHLMRQLTKNVTLKTQARDHHLVGHGNQDWFLLKPDLLIQEMGQNNSLQNKLVLDTKWKLLDIESNDRTKKYGLSQNDFYQLQAYGLNYLNGTGDVVLIYPLTNKFKKALPVFDFKFPKLSDMRLWVLPFCIDNDRLILPTPSPTPADPDSKFPRELFDVNEMNEACSPELCL